MSKLTVLIAGQITLDFYAVAQFDFDLWHIYAGLAHFAVLRNAIQK